jgi:hypothetical protein
MRASFASTPVQQLDQLDQLGAGVHDDPVMLDRARRVVARPRHLVPLVPDDQRPHRHLVRRQRAGLVGADHGRRPERLDGGQPLHQRLPPGHPLGRHREGEGHRGQQPFGHEGDDHPEGEDEPGRERHRGHDLRQGEEDEPHADRDGPHRAGHGHELPLEGAQLTLRRAREAGDRPELRRHAGGGDDRLAPPARHGRPGEDGVQPFGRRPGLPADRGRRERRGGASDRTGFAGERRLVDAQLVGLHHAGVGRHPLPLGQQEHVPGDQRLGVDVGLDALAEHPRLVRQQPAERLDGPLGPELLPGAERAVEQVDDPHRDGELRQGGEQGEDAGSPQQQRHEVAHVGHEADQQPRWRIGHQMVRSVPRQPLGRLDAREPAVA